MAQGYGRYSQAYQKAAVATVDQGKLIVMLYDGAIRFLTQAQEKMRQNEAYEAHTLIIKGKSIIAELMGSLNLEKGGDIAQNLQRLYSFMFNALVDANVSKDPAKLDLVLGLLKELREGWKAISAGAQGGAAQATGSKPVNIQG